MIELLIGLVLGWFLAKAVAELCELKAAMQRVRQKHMLDFFKHGEELLAWEGLAEKDIRKIALLAREMSDRSTQMLVVAALKEASKAENAQPVKSASTAGFPPDKEQLWQSMFSSWLVAVSAQGSVAGFSALAELLIRPAAGKALRRAGNIVEHRLAFAH
jgi:hypothetical protein